MHFMDNVCISASEESQLGLEAANMIVDIGQCNNKLSMRKQLIVPSLIFNHIFGNLIV